MDKKIRKALGAAKRLKAAGRVSEAQAILGHLKKLQTQPQVPKPTLVKGRWIYRLWSADERLLYIGITDRGHIREREHARTKAWWPEVHHASYERVSTRAELRHLEAVAIRREKPKYNVQHNGRR